MKEGGGGMRKKDMVEFSGIGGGRGLGIKVRVVGWEYGVKGKVERGEGVEGEGIEG